ncbi:SCP-like protein, partial [Oesophagostomum dentatum]
SSCEGSKISDKDRQKFLEYHNEARRRIAKGSEPNMNSAKNMYKLKWDCWLERKVDEVIQGCPSSAKVGGHLSQNIVRWNNVNGSIIRPSMLVKLTLASWWRAGERYGVPSSQEYNNEKLTTFANMAYSKASRVGCSYVACGNSITLSCLYNAKWVEYSRWQRSDMGDWSCMHKGRRVHDLWQFWMRRRSVHGWY